jgi:hypothetical protein
MISPRRFPQGLAMHSEPHRPQPAARGARTSRKMPSETRERRDFARQELEAYATYSVQNVVPC